MYRILKQTTGPKSPTKNHIQYRITQGGFLELECHEGNRPRDKLLSMRSMDR